LLNASHKIKSQGLPVDGQNDAAQRIGDGPEMTGFCELWARRGFNA